MPKRINYGYITLILRIKDANKFIEFRPIILMNGAYKINYGYITLILRVKGANKFTEFRPIILVNGAYKIIAKIMFLRLRRVIDEVIRDSQFAFILGRYILDFSLLAYKLWIVCETTCSTFLFKMDFQKAFDSVTWDFIF